MKRRLSVIISIVLSICLAGCDDLKLRDKRELYDYEMGYRDEVPSAGVVSADASAGVGPGDETVPETAGDSQGENPEAVEEYSGEEGFQESPDVAPSENGEGNPGENGGSGETSGNPDADASGGSNTDSSGNPDNNSGSSLEGSGGSDNSGTPSENTDGSGNGQNSTPQSSDNNGNASGGSNGSTGSSDGSGGNSNGSSDGSNGSNGDSNGSQDGSGGSSENGGENHDNSSSENGGENHDNGSSENGGENHDNGSSENGGGNHDNGGSGQQDNSSNNGENNQNNDSGNQAQQDDSTKLRVRDVWTVEGSWSFSLDAVMPGITVGDSDRNPAAVYMIQYTYWNEGLKGDDGSDKELIFSLSDHIIDNAGRAGYSMNVDNSYEPQPVYPGQSCTAQIWVGVDNPGPFDVVVGEYDSTGNYQEVVYHLEV
ncbi:MAG: hypothetical protein K5770_20200 [Lachnospiraceae bacterium]|nr:hypothetical protein [Lachnospiraceae bacterium]